MEWESPNISQYSLDISHPSRPPYRPLRPPYASSPFFLSSIPAEAGIHRREPQIGSRQSYSFSDKGTLS